MDNKLALLLVVIFSAVNTLLLVLDFIVQVVKEARFEKEMLRRSCPSLMGYTEEGIKEAFMNLKNNG